VKHLLAVVKHLAAGTAAGSSPSSLVVATANRGSTGVR
jgi:hypothetical protein